jgi:hypothetical protein
VSNDSINNPDHYTIGIEVYDFIESWKLGFAEGNIVKYVARSEHKGSPVEDLKKARWYLNRLISRKEREIASKVSAALHERE